MRSSFSQLLQRTERNNRNALMKKAFLANRLAKTTKGMSKIISYGVKTKALNAIIEKFPNEVELNNDEAFPEMVVVNVTQTRFGLHIPRIAISAYV